MPNSEQALPSLASKTTENKFVLLMPVPELRTGMLKAQASHSAAGRTLFKTTTGGRFFGRTLGNSACLSKINALLGRAKKQVKQVKQVKTNVIAL